MPQLTVKTVHIEKLKRLGVYDKWLANMKLQYDAHKEYIQKTVSWDNFIAYSFAWKDTPEGWDFWIDIANKYNKSELN